VEMTQKVCFLPLQEQDLPEKNSNWLDAPSHGPMLGYRPILVASVWEKCLDFQ
jgi:hypothetical protein